MSAPKPIDQSSSPLFSYQEPVCRASESEPLVCSAEDLDSYSTQLFSKSPDSNYAPWGVLAYFGNGIEGVSSVFFASPSNGSGGAPGFDPNDPVRVKLKIPPVSVGALVSACDSDPVSKNHPSCPTNSIEVEKICYFEGNLEYYIDGQIKSGTLAVAQSIQGKELQANNKVFFTPDGHVEAVEIISNQEIQGIVWKGGTRVAFYPSDGMVFEGFLAKDQEIQWIEWKGGTILEFYPQSHGTVRQGILAKDQEFLLSGIAAFKGANGIKFKGGQILELNLDRSLKLDPSTKN
jgi:hypothetical protein